MRERLTQNSLSLHRSFRSTRQRTATQAAGAAIITKAETLLPPFLAFSRAISFRYSFSRGGPMDYQEILGDVQDYVATVTLNRPQKLNAYTNLMGDELTHAYTMLGKRDDVRVIIMTGAGRGFCSGADVGAVFQKQIN